MTASTPIAADYDDATAYLNEMARDCYIPLARTEQLQLARAARAGDTDAEERLIQTNLRFVVNVAQKTQCRGLTLMDKIAAGNEGLLVAVERFDPDRGFAFITYAVTWIRQRIQAAAHTPPTIRLPLNRLGNWSRWRKVENRLAHRLGRTPTVAELADAVRCPEHEIDAYRNRHRREISLAEPANADTDAPLELSLADAEAVNPADALERTEVASRLRDALHILDERDAAILCAYFGIDCAPQTLEEIGRDWGITRERVRQIKERALESLSRRASVRALALN